jgi:1-acyl-sn-glycerol-3-phosphate acyltransferase
MKYEKWSLGYFLLKGYVKLAHRLVHRKIIVTGKEKLPKGKPIVFVPNHQNALCDSLAILSNLPYQPVWLSRADIFKNKAVRWILQFMKMMPIYRIRDGKENLGKNDQTFSDSIKVLENNFALALFPEAAHSGKRHMIPHKKAVPRIVFMAEEKTDFKLDIQIVPVGIYYSHYWKFNRVQIVNIGDPIPVKDFEEHYKENQNSANLILRDRIYNAILPLIVDFKTKVFYTEFELIRELYRKRLLEKSNFKKTRLNLFKVEQKIANELNRFEIENPIKIRELCFDVAKYDSSLRKAKLRDWLLAPGQNSIGKLFLDFLILLVGFPFFMYGAMFNALPFILIDKLVKTKVKDTVFWSTFFFPLGLILFPIFYIT